MPELSNGGHERFAQLVALDGKSPAEAHELMGRKGHHSRNGRKLRALPAIKNRIQELQTEVKDKRIQLELYTREDVIKGLLRNIDEARSAIAITARGEPVEIDGEYVPKIDHRSVNQAYELLGREIGMFPKQSKVDMNYRRELDGLTIDQVLELAKRELWEATDGAIDLDIGALRRALGAGSGETPGRAATQLDDGAGEPL